LPVVSNIILAFLLILANWYFVSWTGLPSPAYFPFSSIAGEALVPASFPLAVPKSSSSFAWLWNIFNPASYVKEKTSTVTIPKYAAELGDLSLSTALQYSPAVALPQLQQIMYEFTTKVYQPAYEDFATLVHTGNTDGLVLLTFRYS
jgi:aromatic amino acid aminotransferase I / 2-aminoadipate transaminase